MHTDSLHHQVVASLPAPIFKAWVQLLCLAKLGEGSIPKVSEIAFHLRCGLNSAQRWTDELVNDYGLLERFDNGTFRPKNWDKHQYKSDNVTERVRAFRKRKGNVSETPPETETETETETEQSQKQTRKPARVPHETTDFEERFSLAWDRHKKHRGGVTRQMVAQRLLDVDWDAWDARHTPFCEFWDRAGWTVCNLTMLEWHENGMPLPPPEAIDRKPAKSKTETILEELRRAD
jgi:hypothetical protein